MKTGLFFGSFNPVHSGHLMIASYMAQFTDLDEVWMVVSPQNPLKNKSSLANDYDRLHLVKVATEYFDKIKDSDIEFGLPKPSYTIDTLAYLAEKYPKKEFVLIMGGDNLATFDKWKNYDKILEFYSIYVYQRPEIDLGKFKDHPKVKVFDAPLMEISSTFIRKMLREGKDIRYFVSDSVYQAISDSNMYK